MLCDSEATGQYLCRLSKEAGSGPPHRVSRIRCAKPRRQQTELEVHDDGKKRWGLLEDRVALCL